MKKKILSIIALSLALLMALCACGQSSGGNNSSNNTEPAAGGKHLNAAIYWSAATLDPAVDYDGWTTCRAGITETLVMVNEKLQLVPLLSDRWTQPDSTTWVMHIREGVTFHNGKKVDAEAVKACFERTMKMQSRATTACKIESMTANGQDLTIKTSEPFGAFLANLSEPLYSVIDVTDSKNPATDPVGTGPFMVTSFKAEDAIEVVAYKDYWGGAPKIDSATIKTISDDHTRCLALQGNQIDIGQRINSNDISVLRKDSNYTVYETAGTRVRVMILNHKNQFLSDIRVRKALELALDYDNLVKIMGDTYTKAGAPFPSSAPYGYDQLDVQHFDLEQAKKLLAEAGYKDSDGNGYVEKDGSELALELTYDDKSIAAAMEAVQSMAKEAGIKIVLKPVESTSELDTTKAFDILIRNWQSLSTGDPQWLLDTMYKTGAMTNLGNYSNPELDKVCNDLANAFDFETRQKLAIEAEKIILADCVNIMMFGQNNFVMSKANVSNVKPFPIDYYFLDNTISID